MNRKDIRTNEREWRQTNQPKGREWKQPKKGLRVVTILKVLAVVALLLLAADQLNQCKSMFGPNSKYCVD